MKSTLLALALLAASGATFAEQFADYADVVNVVPVGSRQSNTQTCTNEVVGYSNQNNSGNYNSGSGDRTVGTVTGGLLGGLIGNQIGKGRGRTLAIAAGAVGGSIAGNQYARYDNGNSNGNSGRGEPVYARNCRQDNNDYAQRIEGYKVTYVYNGREMTTMMSRDPGSRIRVGVSVQPQ